jgi:histidine kinase/DNA gyrase B/HSP90-like ATPase
MRARTTIALAGGESRRPGGDFDVVASVRSLADPRCHAADLIVLGVDFDRDAAELMLLAADSLPPVLVTAPSLLRTDIWMARRSGARGYIASADDPLPALRAVRDGGEHWPASLGERPGWLAEEDPLIRFGAFARERERARYARLLHDTVLQTLEGLVLSKSIADPAVQGLLADEAAWLRHLIAQPPPAAGPDPVGALSTLAQGFRARGLRVELTTRGNAGLDAAAVRAVVEATGEALRNVVKHAATDRAAVTAAARDRTFVVRVADAGAGFDTSVTRAGFGLSESIGARLHAVGGTAVVRSAPGRGTVVELTVPLRR